MSIFKRGNVYWFHFLFNGEHIQRSTKQGNPRIARQIEAAHRTALAKGEVGIVDKQPAPTLAKFIEDRFEPWARASFEQASPKTWTGWYRTQLANISSYAPLVNRKLGSITSEHIADYAAFLQTKEWQPSSVNSSLRVLRRVLRLAVEWGTADSAPKVKLLRGEHHREHVVSREEEARYLVAANELLADIVAVLSDTGMRPEENARLRWESIRWHNGQHGTLQVTHGKTAAARRMLPLSPRVRAILESRWQERFPTRRGVGVVIRDEEWAYRTIHAQETTSPRATRKQGAPVRDVRASAYIPDAPRRGRLRRLDAGANRRALVHRNVSPLRSPEFR